MFGMIFSKIGSMVAKHASKTSIVLAKKAPDILFGLGVTCVVGGTIAAIVQTEKASDAIDIFNERKERVEDDVTNELIDQAEAQSHMRYAYGHLIMSMAKIYLPTVLLTTGGILLLGKSHMILNKRNAGLAAAYAALSNSYSEYRRRVRERFGEEVENDIYNGYITTTYTELETSENGVTTEVEKTKLDYNPCSPFAFLISAEDCPIINTKDRYAILSRIRINLNQINNDLQASQYSMIPGQKAFVTVNDVYKWFGQPLSKEGATWVIYDYVDLGIDLSDDGIQKPKPGSPVYNFLNKITDGLWLVPNVQGTICDDVDVQLRNAGLKKALLEDKSCKVSIM